MLKTIYSLLFVSINLLAFGQCSTVSVQISSSDTSLVQLYNAGFFNIPSGFDNVCEWEVTDFSGQIIHQETTSGSSSEQSTVLFNHSVPLTDSMKASIVITNTTSGIVCTMSDTLYWKETQVLGSIFGNWDVLSSNPGVEELILSNKETDIKNQNVKIFPSLVSDYLQIESKFDGFSLHVVNTKGQFLLSYENVKQQDRFDLSNLASGIYFIQIWKDHSQNRIVKKIVKL